MATRDIPLVTAILSGVGKFSYDRITAFVQTVYETRALLATYQAQFTKAEDRDRAQDDRINALSNDVARQSGFPLWRAAACWRERSSRGRRCTGGRES
ncbi:MAG: hypothetical protein ACOY0T_37835 [Myxococcota bacterium]